MCHELEKLAQNSLYRTVLTITVCNSLVKTAVYELFCIHPFVKFPRGIDWCIKFAVRLSRSFVCAYSILPQTKSPSKPLEIASQGEGDICEYHISSIPVLPKALGDSVFSVVGWVVVNTLGGSSSEFDLQSVSPS